MTAIRKPTTEQLRQHMAQHHCGMAEAKRKLMKQWRTEMLELVAFRLAIGDHASALEDILAYLIEVENAS